MRLERTYARPNLQPRETSHSHGRRRGARPRVLYLVVRAGELDRYEAALALFLAEVLYDRARFDEAAMLARSTKGPSGRNQELDARKQSMLARLLARRGQLHEAQHVVGEAIELSDGIEEPIVRLAALIAAAEVAEADGRAGEARQHLEQARNLMHAKATSSRSSGSRPLWPSPSAIRYRQRGIAPV